MGYQEKKCIKCKEVKSIEDFYKHKSGKYGVASLCKECKAKYHKDKSKPQKPKICPICKKEFIPKKTSQQIYCITASGDSPCFRKSVSEKRKIIAEKKNAHQREYYKNNPDKLKEKNKRKSEKRKSDPKLHLNNIISVAIRRSLKNGKMAVIGLLLLIIQLKI